MRSDAVRMLLEATQLCVPFDLISVFLQMRAEDCFGPVLTDEQPVGLSIKS